jgi:hypothetical protein
MAVSKDLVMDQSASVAMEATRLAGEACDAIKASRESIRTALRELGAASDISEASIGNSQQIAGGASNNVNSKNRHQAAGNNIYNSQQIAGKASNNVDSKNRQQAAGNSKGIS